ncbi:MAG: HD domain-containing protein [Planctomycetota bacterium]
MECPLPDEARLEWGGFMAFTWNDWRTWALAPRPADLLRQLRATEQLRLFPELAALPGVPQDSQWHPEGDVWVHTLHVCDAAATISEREKLDEDDRIQLLLAALCHDLGKPSTTVPDQGRWKAPGHASAGVPLAEQFLRRVGAPETIISPVLPLVAEHLAHTQPRLSSSALRRLLIRLRPATLPQLIRLIEADLSGRPPLPAGLSPELREFADRAAGVLQQGDCEVGPAGPPPLILGRHLIALGYQPGVWFRQVLQSCHEAQLQGAFADAAGGVEYLQRMLIAEGRDDLKQF